MQTGKGLNNALNYSFGYKNCKMDHCKDLWADKHRFKFCADAKPGSPLDSVVEGFF